MNIIESVSRLNPPLCAITGCRYLSRPLKRRSQRIGKIRLWLNRIKRGKFTFGNSKSERVEGSSRVAPATLLCTCLHLPPLSLSIYIPFSLSSASVRQSFSLFRLVLHGIVPLERCTMRTPQSSRLFTHRQTSIPCIAFCFQTRVPTLERGGRVNIEGRVERKGGASAFHAPLLVTFVVWLFFDREKRIDRSLRSGTCFRMVKFSYTFENHRDN